MIVSIGSPIISGPYGGGNLFVKNLSNYLIKEGHQVVYDLNQKDIDIILLTNPLLFSEVSAYNHNDIEYYLKFINKNALVLHRVNECDERKNSNNVNKQIIEANQVADYTIYVSAWIQNLYKSKGLSTTKSKVILSGSDENIFFINEDKFKLKSKKLKLVTHHWSNNWNKGFDIYKKIDQMLELNKWNSKFSFTYIGNLPKNFKFTNVHHELPKSDSELGKILRSFDGYITASINEPSGNHHIEAAQSGLPILYINSGGIPEYCEGYGLAFTENDFEEKLTEFIDQFYKLQKKMVDYPLNASISNKQYLMLFEELIYNRKKLLDSRAKKSKFKIIIVYIKNKIKILSYKYYQTLIKIYKSL